jgi:glycogen debranching enzyme
VASIERSSTGSPTVNPDFDVAAVGFNALVAFGAVELGDSVGDGELATEGRGLAVAIEERWDDDLGTWTDAGASEDGSGRVRVADALLPALVSPHRDRSMRALSMLLDDRSFGGRCGPAGVHRDEPSFSPRTYWRGPAWPQLSYLAWLAARRWGLHTETRSLCARAVEGARRSGFAEYWEPDTGEGLGAVPQSWSTLVAVMADRGRRVRTS